MAASCSIFVWDYVRSLVLTFMGTKRVRRELMEKVQFSSPSEGRCNYFGNRLIDHLLIDGFQAVCSRNYFSTSFTHMGSTIFVVLCFVTMCLILYHSVLVVFRNQKSIKKKREN